MACNQLLGTLRLRACGASLSANGEFQQTVKRSSDWHGYRAAWGFLSHLITQLLNHKLMARAIWGGQVIAESDRCEVVEGNQYFPPEAVKRELLKDSTTHTTCGWKGIASYYDVVVDGKVNKDAAWYYPDPKPAAKNIAGYFAFWKGVKVEP